MRKFSLAYVWAAVCLGTPAPAAIQSNGADLLSRFNATVKADPVLSNALTRIKSGEAATVIPHIASYLRNNPRNAEAWYLLSLAYVENDQQELSDEAGAYAAGLKPELNELTRYLTAQQARSPAASAAEPREDNRRPASAAAGRPLSPNQGSMTVRGTLTDTNGGTGSFEIQAVLREGKFSGAARIQIADELIEAPLYEARSYLENKRCIFYLESGRSRAELSGPCDTSTYGRQGGRLDSWFPTSGAHVGTASGQIEVSSPGRAAQGGVLPTGKLLCSYQEFNTSFRAGQPGQLGQIVSMGALTFSSAGNYVAGVGNSSGRYTKSGDKVTFTSGPWEGAVGTLEPDRSGKPSLTIDKEESQANGRVLPQTTRCTARG